MCILLPPSRVGRISLSSESSGAVGRSAYDKQTHQDSHPVPNVAVTTEKLAVRNCISSWGLRILSDSVSHSRKSVELTRVERISLPSKPSGIVGRLEYSQKACQVTHSVPNAAVTSVKRAARICSSS